MDTQLPILNVVNTQNASRPASQADPETPFHQVLDKEVKNRNSDSKNAPKETTSPAVKSSATTDTSTTAAATSPSANEKDDEQTEPDDNTASTTLNQLLTLVVNVNPDQMQINQSVRPSLDNQVPNLQTQDEQTLTTPIAKTVDTFENIASTTQTFDKRTLAPVNGALPHDLTNPHGLSNQQKNNLTKQPDLASMNGMDQALADNKPSTEIAFKPVHIATEKASLETAAKTPASQQEAATLTADVKLAAKIPETLPTASISSIVSGLSQPVAPNQQTAAHTPVITNLTPEVGSHGWGQALGQKMVWMANGTQQTASLTLNPPELGPLQVIVHVKNAQADATFITAQPDVKQAIETAMPKLREMMGQAGIQLGQATVNTGMPNQQQSSHQSQQTQSAASHFGVSDNLKEAELSIPIRQMSSKQGLVDTFA